MKKANLSHLPTKITAKDRAKQFPNVLHESGGKLFCTPCNIVMEHKRKSSLDSHFSTAKHLKMVLMPQHRHRRITVTEATISKSVASSESIKDHSLSPPTTSVANEPTSLIEHITKDSTGKIDTVTIKSEVLSDPGGKMNKVSTQCKTEQRCSADVPIGFVGAGNMAFGITQGILMSGEVSAENVRVSAPSSNNLGRFREMGVGITHSNTEVVSSSRLVFLAVKPHLVPGVLQEIASHVTREHIVVSVAAGVTVATVEALLPPDSVVLRLMPNLPCLVQEGALLFARGSKARPEHGALLRDLLAPCGLVEEGPESWIDAHTGLSGSGVAFVYLFAEALAEGGVKMGMPSALAHRIAAQTVLGAGRLLRDSGKHPAQLRADVCTPGGTTIFGLHELERGGVRAATMGAVEAATERARELGRK